ncbi:MAG TPA: AzlC family ABC transporter permease [Dongiaceae bacterium]|jgi:4-azaleucine resistance transporter AzlC
MTPSEAPPFTWTGFRAGVVRGMVLVPSIALYGIAFGIMASAAGLSTAESMLYSGVVFAGGAQMASLEAWTEPVTFIAVTLTTLAMNARYLLLGATLRPWYRGLPAHKAYLSMFALGDGNWALQMREYEAGRLDAAFLLGSAFFVWFLWVGTTAAGHVFGQLLGDPHRFGADFMLAAFFASMAVVFFRKTSQIWPLLAGVAVAVVVEKLVEGPWYILAGALAGSLVGAFRRADPA